MAPSAATSVFLGDRKRYSLEPRPLGEGGYAQVFRAIDKTNGEVVALKKAKGADGKRRLLREIRALSALAPHLHVMEIFDADNLGGWYVMPLADGDLNSLRPSMSTADVVDALSDAAEALAAAHLQELIHRDVTPKNILAFDGRSRWVLADWGLVRGRPGTTSQRLTRTGVVLGTDGFIAPEVLRDSHSEAGPASDVYGLGRVAAWATTGQWPLAGEELLPVGPWRGAVRDATRGDPADRCSLSSFVERMREVTYEPAEQLWERAARLAQGARLDGRAATELLDLADANQDDAALFFDYVPSACGPVLIQLVKDRSRASVLIGAMNRHLQSSGEGWGKRPFNAANPPLAWLRAVASAAADAGELGVLEDAAEALFAAGASWRRFEERQGTRAWLERLGGQPAETVARALRRDSEARLWLLEEGWQPAHRAHRAIRDALGP